MRTSCDSAGGSSVPEGQGRLQFLTLLVVSKLRFCSIQTIFRVFSCIPTPRHDCLGGQMNTDMNGPEISWRFISSRGKTASTFVWISGQATSPLKDFFTSILSEEDCFRIRVREISRKRSGFAYLVTAGVLPLPDFLSPHFFSLGVGVPFVQRAVSWRRSPWWTGSSSRFGLSSEAHGSAEESQVWAV